MSGFLQCAIGALLAGCLCPGAAASCTAVEGDHILGSDLARAAEAFAALPPDFVVGFAPVPGFRRVMDPGTLANIARSHGIVLNIGAPLCFERPTRVLDEEQLRPALELAIGEGVRIDIVDFSRFPVPKGEILFSARELPGAPMASGAAVVWRGRVRYSGTSTVAIWAKVRVSRLEQWVETTATIPARTRIEPTQVVVKSGWRYPFARPPARELEQVVGKLLVRSLTGGQPVLPSLLAAPYDVEKGEPVDVEVASGAVTLRFSARAETSGHRNEAVLVAASDTGKRYRAFVVEKGKVAIHADTRNHSTRTDRRSHGGNPPAPAGGTEEAHVSRAGIGTGQVSR